MEQYKNERIQIENVILKMTENKNLMLSSFLSELIGQLSGTDREFNEFIKYDNCNEDLSIALDEYFNGDYMELTRAIFKSQHYNPYDSRFIVKDNSIISISDDEYIEQLKLRKNDIIISFIQEFGYDEIISSIEEYSITL